MAKIVRSVSSEPNQASFLHDHPRNEHLWQQNRKTASIGSIEDDLRLLEELIRVKAASLGGYVRKPIIASISG